MGILFQILIGKHKMLMTVCKRGFVCKIVKDMLLEDMPFVMECVDNLLENIDVVANISHLDRR